MCGEEVGGVACGRVEICRRGTRGLVRVMIWIGVPRVWSMGREEGRNLFAVGGLLRRGGRRACGVES